MCRNFSTSEIIDMPKPRTRTPLPPPRAPLLQVEIEGHRLVLIEQPDSKPLWIWTHPEGEALAMDADRVRELLDKAFWALF